MGSVKANIVQTIQILDGQDAKVIAVDHFNLTMQI